VKFRSIDKSRNELNRLNSFRLCRKDETSFDIVAINRNIVARNGNNVEATFDFVERIVRLVAFDNVASTLLLQIRLLFSATKNDSMPFSGVRKL